MLAETDLCAIRSAGAAADLSCQRAIQILTQKRKDNMNRRELLAALAATAVVGETQAHADSTGVMGSKVFDWKDMVDKPNDHGSTRPCATHRR
jgi:hypothetical protein